MKALFSYHLTRILRKKSMWGVLIFLIVANWLLEAQVTPAVYDLPANALLARFLSPDATQEDLFRICFTGSQMSLGAIFLLLGAAVGGDVLCPALRASAMLPITAVGYTPRQQSRCCVLLALLLCGLGILAALLGEFLLPNSSLTTMARIQPQLLLLLELTRLLLYLGNAGLGLLLCRVFLRCDIALVLGSLFTVAETLPNLSRICVILPSGSIKQLLFGPSHALPLLLGILESAVILLLCFLPIGKEVSP